MYRRARVKSAAAISFAWLMAPFRFRTSPDMRKVRCTWLNPGMAIAAITSDTNITMSNSRVEKPLQRLRCDRSSLPFILIEIPHVLSPCAINGRVYRSGQRLDDVLGEALCAPSALLIQVIEIVEVTERLQRVRLD